MTMNFDTVYTNAKAGMDGVDQERIKHIVYEMSKDSAYFQNELRKNTATEERIRAMLEKKRKMQIKDFEAAEARAKAMISELEATRDLTRIWIHVDMDAFFASVEEILDPSLSHTPFAVGGMGMISTANYEARKFGVRSAMPGFIAVKLCPNIRFVKPKFEKYREYCMITRERVFKLFDPNFATGSLDEAYLDVTDYSKATGKNGEDIASIIKELVQSETKGLTCSCGIASNKMLAKICSDINKPNGVFELANDKESIMMFMHKLPTRKVPGIGRVTERILQSFSISSCGEILSNAGTILALFSPVSSSFFIKSSLGLGSTSHSDYDEGDSGRKGISCERTFTATSCEKTLLSKLSEISENLANDVAKNFVSLRGKTVTLKMKMSTFEVKTKSLTLNRHIGSPIEIFKHARDLLMEELPAELRLLGVRISNFWEDVRPESGQLLIDQIMTHGAERSARSDNKKCDEADKSHCRNGWTCSACTYHNRNKSTWCEICMTSRSGYRLGGQISIEVKPEERKRKTTSPKSGSITKFLKK